MGKIKTRKSAAKRFKITATGKVMYRHQMGRHLRRKKSASSLRNKRVDSELTGAFAKKVKQMMGV